MIGYVISLFGLEDAIELRRELNTATAALDRQTRWHAEATAERDEARELVVKLEQENITLRKTNGMFRSLIGILRDVNSELDERNVHLEQLHGVTPGERLAAVQNDAPDRCTEKASAEPAKRFEVVPVVDASDAEERLRSWEGHGLSRWGIGVAIDIEWLDRRISELEGKVFT
ncbi:MAG: hypothetical protein RLZZ21_1379 [Planctomycetota bacterium]